MHFSTGLLLTTVLSSVALAFFIVGSASVSKGWFKAEIRGETIIRAWWGTTSFCANQTGNLAPNFDDCPLYSNWTSPQLLYGGRTALVFTIIGAFTNGMALVFTGVIGRFTSWRFPHLRFAHDCIATACALTGTCCGFIAVTTFFFLMPTHVSNFQPHPDYAWILVLIGSFLDILLAGATCIHVIIPDTESPWHEETRPISDLEDEQLLMTQEDDENSEFLDERRVPSARQNNHNASVTTAPSALAASPSTSSGTVADNPDTLPPL